MKLKMLVMKKLIFLVLLVAGWASAGAQSFTYLNLTMTDNSTRSLTADGLKITFADGNLTARNGAATQTVPLAGIKAFSFSDNASDGIADINSAPVSARGLSGAISVTAPAGASVSVYNLLGSKVYEAVKGGDGEQVLDVTLPQGVYVVRINTISIKVLVR